MATRTTPSRGYSATKEQLIARLRRIEGQVRGVQRMVEEDRYCIDVVTQISAIEGALEKVALGLLDEHARHCVMTAEDATREERTEELVAAFGRVLGRR
jgi:DNA-binding FrmR family transcriptional regulator